MELRHKVTITIPSTMGLNKPVDNTDQTLYVAKKLAEMFGGSRIIKGIQGFYIADNGQEVVEVNNDVIAYCQELTDEQVEEVIKLALEIKEAMKQETILYEIDGVAYIE